jgi:hypothetical protein
MIYHRICNNMDATSGAGKHNGSHKWGRNCSLFQNTLGLTPGFLAVLVFLNYLIFFVVLYVLLFVYWYYSLTFIFTQ